MQQIHLSFPANRAVKGQFLSGVVGSGDLEVLLAADPTSITLNIDILTSIDNSQSRWQALFDRLWLLHSPPAGNMQIHDFGSTPGVARIRIEQVLEEVNAHAASREFY